MREGREKSNVVKNLRKIKTDTVYVSCTCLINVQELYSNQTFEGPIKQILNFNKYWIIRIHDYSVSAKELVLKKPRTKQKSGEYESIFNPLISSL